MSYSIIANLTYSTNRLAALLLAASLTLLISSASQAQTADPYYNRALEKQARQAYLANLRAKASQPVQYTFPVRPDLSTAINAASYSPAYQFSQRSPGYRYPGASAYSGTSYTGVASAPRTAYRPPAYAPNRGHRAYGGKGGAPCPYAAGHAGTAHYRGYTPASPALGALSPTYVGSSLAGPPKVYPKDEPFRNLFRYLTP